jgi:hypothetical protein
MINGTRAFALILFLLSAFGLITAQHTVGLLGYDFSQTSDGYNLFYPHNQPHVFLIDNCGEIVNTWVDEPLIRPGNSVYLQANGDLIKCSRYNTVTDDVIWAGGGGEFIEIRDWDNNLKWKFTLNDSLQRIHHDIAVLPNGNILALAWDRKLKSEAIAAGRDSAMINKGEIWPEAILEIQPQGDSFLIVWEWHVWDHLVQDFDSSKANYGVISENPELININWGSNEGTSSWMHANAIDYHPVLDQILISIPTFNEIWIIDHSTTTEEASGHSGGMSDRGGDLMFRWGNPAVYDRGGTEDQKLFFQHNAHWIDEHLDLSHPYFGKIAIYNNRVGPDSSTVNIIDPLFVDYAWMYGMDLNGTFLPSDYFWSYSHPDKAMMFSGGLSSIQFLNNGNWLINTALLGYAFEVALSGQIVWEYKVPLRGGNPVAQGELLLMNENLTWRVNRYPQDFPGFAGRDLSGNGFIELNPDTAFCELISAVIDEEPTEINVYPNPVYNRLIVEWEYSGPIGIQLIDNLGITVLTESGVGGRKYLDLSHIVNGVYWLRIGKAVARKVIVAH